MRRLCALVAVALAVSPSPAADPPAEAVEFFEKKVRPVFVEHCYSCHGDKKQQAGLRLDTADGMRKGTDDGPVVIPGEPTKSKLLKAVRREGDFPMPPKKALPPEALAALTEWVKIGAPFPAAQGGTTQVNPQAKAHWAFQPVRQPEIPSTKHQIPTNPIDAFILAKLDARGLKPAAPADKRTLIRRAYFDLLGLPPTFAEVEGFVADTSPDAFEKLIDQLLASPHYGERWARHWLDVARYADTKGYVFTDSRAYPYAYTYRGYVIRAFNEDKPFDQFVREQLAADLLPKGDPRNLAALGFLTVGRRFMNNAHDIIDDRIDVVTRGLMGLTVSCARCHDHKYDPIPAADYYSLYGVFASTTEPKELPLIGEVPRTPELEAFEKDIARREAAMADDRENRVRAKKQLFAGALGTAGAAVANADRVLNRVDRDALTKLRKRIEDLKAASPFAPPRAMVLTDSGPVQPVVFLRGNPNSRGPAVPRQAPAVVSGPNRKPFAQGSGRLELANAIVSADNPLTARVFVNRVWQHLFGRGIVRTPSDFGTRSDPPTHPELLDFLAKRFVEDGWSVKKLHKRIMLSAAYQRASMPPASADPENVLLGTMNRRRLDFEALRDGLLTAAGKLDRTLYGRSVDLFAQPFTTRRAVYGYVDRQNLPGTFRVFDFASPDQHTPSRFLTTVPQQALFLMNSPFVARQAKAVAARPDVAWAFTSEEKVRRLYRATLARNPTADELALATAFASAAAKPAAGQLGAWEQLAQVLLLSNEFAFVD